MNEEQNAATDSQTPAPELDPKVKANADIVGARFHEVVDVVKDMLPDHAIKLSNATSSLIAHRLKLDGLPVVMRVHVYETAPNVYRPIVVVCPTVGKEMGTDLTIVGEACGNLTRFSKYRLIDRREIPFPPEAEQVAREWKPEGIRAYCERARDFHGDTSGFVLVPQYNRKARRRMEAKSKKIRSTKAGTKADKPS